MPAEAALRVIEEGIGLEGATLADSKSEPMEFFANLTEVLGQA